MKIAIFDYDNTLSEGYSKYDVGFALEDAGLIKKGFRQEIEKLENDYDDGLFDYNEKFLKDKQIFIKYFNGLKRTDIVRFINDDFDLSKNQYPWAKELINKLHENGFIVVIISGCWDFIIEEAQEILDFDTFYASEFVIRDSKLTKEFVQIMDNNMKRKIVERLLKDSELSIGMGDSTADFEILDRVDHPFLISNNKEAVNASKNKNFTLVNKENAGEVIIELLNSIR